MRSAHVLRRNHSFRRRASSRSIDGIRSWSRADECLSRRTVAPADRPRSARQPAGPLAELAADAPSAGGARAAARLEYAGPGALGRTHRLDVGTQRAGALAGGRAQLRCAGAAAPPGAGAAVTGGRGAAGGAGRPDKFGVGELLPAGALPVPGTVVLSANDPWLAEAAGQRWARRWGCRVEMLGAAGHVNIASGFGPLPLAERWLQSQQRRLATVLAQPSSEFA